MKRLIEHLRMVLKDRRLRIRITLDGGLGDGRESKLVPLRARVGSDSERRQR